MKTRRALVLGAALALGAAGSVFIQGGSKVDFQVIGELSEDTTDAHSLYKVIQGAI
jgi:hypothetical protein